MFDNENENENENEADITLKDHIGDIISELSSAPGTSEALLRHPPQNIGIKPQLHRNSLPPAIFHLSRSHGFF